MNLVKIEMNTIKEEDAGFEFVTIGRKWKVWGLGGAVLVQQDLLLDWNNLKVYAFLKETNCNWIFYITNLTLGKYYLLLQDKQWVISPEVGNLTECSYKHIDILIQISTCLSNNPLWESKGRWGDVCNVWMWHYLIHEKNKFK